MDNFEFPRSDSAIFVETDIFLDLEDAFDLNGAIVGQRGKPNGTPGAHTLLWPKHLKIVFCSDIPSESVQTSIMRLENPLMMVMHSEPFIVSGFAFTIPNVFTILSTLGEYYN